MNPSIRIPHYTYLLPSILCLQDKEKREKYDNVLRNGLPDWRNPVYYYRKYRKMGTLELSIIVSLIFTVGHYLTWWVAYLEKRFEMDEVLNPIRKRMQKKKAKGEHSFLSPF